MPHSSIDGELLRQDRNASHFVRTTKTPYFPAMKLPRLAVSVNTGPQYHVQGGILFILLITNLNVRDNGCIHWLKSQTSSSKGVHVLDKTRGLYKPVVLC